MKTLLIAPLLFLSVFFSASAQKGTVTIGVEGGLCASNMWGNPGLKVTDSQTLKYTPTGGAFFGYGLGERLALRTGLYFENKGANVVYNPGITEYNAKQKYRVDYNYLVLPILVRFMPCPNKRLFLNAGPYLGYLLNVTEHVEYANYPHPAVTDRTSINKKLDLGVSFGVGYSQPLNAKLAVTIEMRGNLGLLNTSAVPVINDGAIRMNSMNVLLGVAYTLGKE